MAGNSLLQENINIKVGGREFSVPPLGTNTWVKISAYLDKLPEFKDYDSDELSEEQIYDAISVVLHSAGEFVPLVDVLAVGIVGYKTKYSILHRFRIWRLRQWLMCQPRNEIVNGIVQIINDSDLGRFFLNTTFLSKRSLTKPTKVV